LNHQFITQHAVVDHGSDYIATYMQSKLTLGKEKREKMRKGKQKKEN